MKKSILLSILLVFAMQLIAQKPANPNIKVKPKPSKKLEEYVKISTNYGDMFFVLFDNTPKHRDNFKKLIKMHYYDSLLFHRIIRDFMIQGGDPNSKFADSLAILGNGGPDYTIPAEFRNENVHIKGALCAARTADEFNPKKESSGSQFYIVQGRKFSMSEIENLMNSRNYKRKQKIFNDFISSDSSIANKLADLQKTKGKDAILKYLSELQPTIDKSYENKEFLYTADQVLLYKEKGGTPHLDDEYTVFGRLVSGMDVLDKIATVYANPQTNRPIIDIRMNISLVKR
ncbi:MAG: peptidylprolyl isomerase [Bacteroidia bacterium]